MASIHVLVFASQDVANRDSFNSANTLSNYDWALLAESQKHHRLSLKKPYAIIFNRNSSTSAPFGASLRQPILKIRIATTRQSSSLLRRLDELLSTIAPETQPEDWLDETLTRLQKAELVQRFSVLKFHQFVLNTLQTQPAPARRSSSSGTTEIDYLALLSSNAEVKRMLNPEPEALAEEERRQGRQL